MADIINENEEMLKFDGEDEFDTAVLVDENGNETEFEILDFFEYEEKNYAVLYPIEEENSEEVIILEVEPGETEDEDLYKNIDDENVLNAVYELFKQRNPDAFDYID